MDELSYRLIGDCIGISSCIGFAIGTAIIAHYKGRAWGGWFWCGFFLSFIGLIVAACVPVVERKTEITSSVKTFDEHIRDSATNYGCSTCLHVSQKYGTSESNRFCAEGQRLANEAFV